MTDTNIKKRLAEWQTYGVTGTLAELLRDALAALEEQERQIVDLKAERDGYIRKLAENVKEISELREKTKST